MNQNQYKCFVCEGIFDFVRDETWSEERAREEFHKNFPNTSFENIRIVCDDCWKKVKPLTPQYDYE